MSELTRGHSVPPGTRRPTGLSKLWGQGGPALCVPCLASRWCPRPWRPAGGWLPHESLWPPRTSRELRQPREVGSLPPGSILRISRTRGDLSAGRRLRCQPPRREMSLGVFWSRTVGSPWQRPPGAPTGRPLGPTGRVCLWWETGISEHWLGTRAGLAGACGLGWDPGTPSRREPESLPTSFPCAPP